MPQVPTAGMMAVADTENVVAEDVHSSESVMTDNDDGSDMSLKLG